MSLVVLNKSTHICTDMSYTHYKILSLAVCALEAKGVDLEEKRFISFAKKEEFLDGTDDYFVVNFSSEEITPENILDFVSTSRDINVYICAKTFEIKSIDI